MAKWLGIMVHGLIMLVVLGVESPLRADNTVTGMTLLGVDTSNICIGDLVGYRVDFTGSDPVQSVKWQYTFTDCTPPITVDWGTGPYTQMNANETKLGNQTVTAMVTFQRYGTQQTYQLGTSVNVLINPPDHVSFDNAGVVLDVNTATVEPGSGPNLTVKFRMMRGTRRVNCTGTPIESVHYITAGYRDQGWSDPVQFMSITVGTIMDMKGAVNDQAWQFYGNNTRSYAVVNAR